jgi:branched-chain amino acid transport system substrate-binding protein
MKTGWKKTIAPLVLVLGAVALAACGGSDNKTDSGAAAGTDAAAPAAGTLIIGSDLPLQGASADASADTNLAIKLLLEKVGNKAGTFNVGLKEYDDSTAAKGAWDDATCTANANAHVTNKAEVAVMGTYNSGCAKLEVPILNQDPSGPMLMISHANTNPGLTKAWDPGEPQKYYPTGKLNYGRIIATDDFQGKAGAQFAAKELGVKNCYVLNDAQTYGQGVAKAFVDAAPGVGITVIANDAWDSKQTNYTALFEKVKSKNPDCVYLGGINDNNGQQLIKDKVKVLGPNDGAVKLIGPDGFTGYPELRKMPEAQGMYISFAGIPSGELVKQGGFGGTFVTDFKTKYGHDPASFYSIYGAAATQLILAAIAKSDGTRKSVNDAAFSGITIPADQSILGKEFGIDATGDVTVKDMSFNLMKGNEETFLKPWPLDG